MLSGNLVNSQNFGRKMVDLETRMQRLSELLQRLQNGLDDEKQNRRDLFKGLLLEVLESKNIL